MTKCDENYDATCAWMECSLMFLNDTGLTLLNGPLKKIQNAFQSICIWFKEMDWFGICSWMVYLNFLGKI